METHCSILAWKNPMDRGAWLATVHGVPKSQTQLSAKQQIFHCIYVWHLYPFLCWWASRLLPCLGYCKSALWTMGLCTFSSEFVSEYMPRALKLYKQALSIFMRHLSLYSPQICHWCWFSVITLSCIICSLVYQIVWIVISKHFWACFISWI